MARFDEERDRGRRDYDRDWEQEERNRRERGYEPNYGGREFGGREFSGGMGSYSSGSGRGGERRFNEYDRDRGNERRFNEYDRDRDREQWGPDWGGRGFSGREGGWGGYGSYDRERYGSGERGGYSPSRENEPWRSSNQWGSSGNYSSPGPQHGSTGSGANWGAGQWQQPGNNQGWGSGSGWGSGQSWGGGVLSGSQGRHSGRGPRGYQRSDERIREDVNEHLTRHPEVDASEVEVEVHNGEVTLRGTVDHRHTKRMAEDCAEQVSGVRQVHNQIRVQDQRSDQQQRSGGGMFSSPDRPETKSQTEPTPTTTSRK